MGRPSGSSGTVTGWEERGPEWRGFASGGAKLLFALGDQASLRLCVTEAAIDAMSLGALEGLRPDTLYLSTGGGWSPATTEMLFALATRPRAEIVAASDNSAGRYLCRAAQGACGRCRGRLRAASAPARGLERGSEAKGEKEMEERGDSENCRMPAVRLKGEAPPG